jgi:hypothetical protein
MVNVNYELVNPYIDGPFKRVFNGKNMLDTANKCYGELAHHLREPLPKFRFTMRKLKDNKFVHFKVKEKTVSDGSIEYSISEDKIKHTKKELSDFENKIDNIKNKVGGKHKDSSDDSSDDLWNSDSDDLYQNKYKYPIRRDQPILYYYYDPVIYRLKRFYVPHFKLPLSPLVSVYVV